jgi:hypothetical protein
MLKDVNSLKESEARAGEALRRLLAQVPIIQIEDIGHKPREVLATQGAPDLIAHIQADGHHYVLICEFKSNGQPRHARTALLALREYVAQCDAAALPILMAPYLSPAVRKLCQEKDVGYLDLEGNARIAFGGVYIERTVADRPAAEQRELKSLFKPKSAQVLRAMLREPGKAWRVTELSEATGVSLGHVSNVRAGLLDREWARASDAGIFLSEPDALLDAWRQSYVTPAGERRRFYTPLHGSALEDAARGVLGGRSDRGRAAFASFSAAHWLAPYGRTGTQYFFADHAGLEKLQTALKLAPASKGENVVVIVPKDEGPLADTVEPAPGAICTSPIQTYLDLSIAGERGEEAAQHLRRETLSWPK